MRISDNLILNRPEQTFFADPALDRAFGVVIALATGVYVQRNRVRALERKLEAAGIIDRADMDREPSEDERQANAEDREAFVEGLMINLLGKQQAKGAS